MKMKTVTLEQFKTFDPCWLRNAKMSKKLDTIGAQKTEWTALDVLKLTDVSARDRLRAVLREEFIDVNILIEFACCCAEYALSIVDKPDPRSVAATNVIREYIAGVATINDLRIACDAACAAARDAVHDAAYDAARAAYAAARVAYAAARDAACAAARDAVHDAAYDAARAAAYAAAYAAAFATCVARDAACAAACDLQINTLINLLTGRRSYEHQNTAHNP